MNTPPVAGTARDLHTSPRVMRARPLKTLITNTVLFVGSSVLAICLGELALWAGNADWTASFTTQDRDLGWALRPGAEGWFLDEGRAHVRINSHGMRDRDRSRAKPSETVRVAVLGDSTTESLQVDLDRTWPALVEQKLASCAALHGKNVEVLNFGVSGYGTAQELLQLRQRGWAFEPDVVLLAFFPGNDLFNNVRALNPTNPNHAPYFIVRDDKLFLDDAFREMPELADAYIARRNLLGDLMNHSRMLRGAYHAYLGVSMKNEEPIDRDRLGLSSDDEATLFYLPPSHPKSRPQMEDAWRVSESLIQTMRDEVHAHGARFWMTAMTAGRQVHEDPEERAAFAHSLAIGSLDYPNRRLQAFAAREQIPYIDQLGPLGAYATTQHIALHGFPNALMNDGHLNDYGHAVVAAVIAQELCSRAFELDPGAAL
jgi:lysophospholipase L1-like esterase